MAHRIRLDGTWEAQLPVIAAAVTPINHRLASCPGTAQTAPSLPRSFGLLKLLELLADLLGASVSRLSLDARLFGASFCMTPVGVRMIPALLCCCCSPLGSISTRLRLLRPDPGEPDCLLPSGGQAPEIPPVCPPGSSQDCPGEAPPGQVSANPPG
jgi:hypothetical protein